MTDALKIATDYFKRGWHPVPIPYRKKKPLDDGWQKVKLTEDTLPNYFNGADQNIGVQLGPRSNGLTDIDLDCPEAVKLAPNFLPKTDSIFGRASKPRSHFLYSIDDAPAKASIKLKAVDKSCIIELRMGGGGKGAQTVFPGSVHIEGEAIEWVRDGEPAKSTFNELKTAISKIAAATILIRAFPAHGSRHDAMLALGGFLARAGWDKDAIYIFAANIAQVVGLTVPASDAAKVAVDAAESHTRGENVYGLPGLIEFFDEKPARAVAKLLDYGEEGFYKAPDRIGDSEDIEFELNDVRPTLRARHAEIGLTVDDAQAALIEVGVPIYERGGRLVHPVIRTVEASHNRQTKIAQLNQMESGYLRYVLSKTTDWVKWNGGLKKYTRIDPPCEVANMLLSLNAAIWPFPTIKSVINTPTMRPDGSILATPGFDKATGLLLVGMPDMPPIPDRPTRDDALEALDLLKELLAEFPLVDGASTSTALSGFITPIVRGAFPTSPIHISRASTPGTGKSYLWDTAAAISIGQTMMPVISAGASMEELEKRLGAQLITGQAQFSIDNLNGHLDSPALSQYIERPGIQTVRILGKTQNIEIDLTGTMFYASGNNITVSPELARRKLAADLDANMENPGTREFKQNPVAMVLDDRGRYVAAALIICRAYFVAGRPDKAIPFPSFEGWSEVVRSALIWLGETDPVNLSTDEIILSPERAELAEMIDAWIDVIGLGSKYRIKLATLVELASKVTRDASGVLAVSWPNLAAAAQTIAGDKRPDAKNLGRWLQANKGVIINDYKLMIASNPKGGSKWWVQHKDFAEKPKPEHDVPGKLQPDHPSNIAAAAATAATDATGGQFGSEGE
jgi:hypothetical protein